MERKAIEESSEVRPVPVYFPDSLDNAREINLADLWRAIARRKWLALLGFVLSLVLTSIYLFNAEPVYKATAHLLPPHQQSIQDLLVDTGGYAFANIERFTPKYVFNRFLDNFHSRGMRREFFDNRNLLDHYVSADDRKIVNTDQIFDARFNANLQMKIVEDTPSVLIVSFSDTDPELAARWLNQFIDFVNQRTVQQLFDDVDTVLQAEIKHIDDQLSLKLKLAEQRRLDQTTILKEALRVASALGIQDVSTFPTMMDKTDAGLAVNTAQVPLYMRGTHALETEISVIESRKSDEPFITGFRDLQERRTLIEMVSIDQASLSAVTVDDPARVPYRAEKPRKRMIVMLGVVLGIIAGIFLALAAEFLFGVRRESAR